MSQAAFRGRTEQSEHLVDNEPPRCSLESDRRPIAAVRPEPGVLAQSGCHGIPDDIEDRADEMRVRSDLSAIEAILK